MAEIETAQEAALRALRHRDLSVRELDERLRARGYDEAERDWQQMYLLAFLMLVAGSVLNPDLT